MFRAIVGVACAISLASSSYLAGWGGVPHHVLASQGSEECEFCSTAASDSVVLLDSAATKPAATDTRNTKCIVMADDIGDSKHTVEYKGKLYHTCCPDCITAFNKDPEKYVKAFEKDPAKFGVK